MKIVVMNGPNLNLLGIREPAIYGQESYADLIERICAHARKKEIEITCFQSNHEGSLVDEIQRAYFDGVEGIVINPGAYTHTSIALLDAIKSTGLPTVEIHISDPDTREPFRTISYIRPACIATVKGHGTDGYLEAIDLLIDHIKHQTQE